MEKLTDSTQKSSTIRQFVMPGSSKMSSRPYCKNGPGSKSKGSAVTSKKKPNQNLKQSSLKLACLEGVDPTESSEDNCQVHDKERSTRPKCEGGKETIEPEAPKQARRILDQNFRFMAQKLDHGFDNVRLNFGKRVSEGKGEKEPA